MNNISSRSYLFDNLKAFLIFFVVTSHFIKGNVNFSFSGIEGFFYFTSFSFIMQTFFFISGYFSKNVDKCRSTSFKNMLLPYLLLMPLMYWFRLALFGHARFLIFLPTHSLWFLLVMFLYRFFLKNLIQIPHIKFLSVFFYFVSGCIWFFGEFMALGRLFSFFIFFLAGYYFQPEMVLKIKKVRKLYSLTLMILLLCCLAVLVHYKPFALEILYMKNSYHANNISNLTGMGIRLMTGIISAAWIFIFINLTPDRKTILSDMGKTTMTIYAFHIPFRYLIKYFTSNGISFSSPFIFSVILSLAVIFLFSRPFVQRFYSGMLNILYDFLKKAVRLIT